MILQNFGHSDIIIMWAFALVFILYATKHLDLKKPVSVIGLSTLISSVFNIYSKDGYTLYFILVPLTVLVLKTILEDKRRWNNE